MDSILDFLVRQKKFALVFSLAFIAIGVLSVVGMQRDQFPTVDFEVLRRKLQHTLALPLKM